MLAYVPEKVEVEKKISKSKIPRMIDTANSRRELVKEMKILPS